MKLKGLVIHNGFDQRGYRFSRKAVINIVDHIATANWVIYGTLDINQHHLSRASHVVIKAKRDNNDNVVVYLETLNTDAGRHLVKILKDVTLVGILNGSGDRDDNGVMKSFKLDGISITHVKVSDAVFRLKKVRLVEQFWDWWCE